MCLGLGSIYGSDDFDRADGRDSDHPEPSGPASPIVPYQSPYQVVIDVPSEIDYGFPSTCKEDRQYERDISWNSGNYDTSYHWAMYLDGNRPAPCSNVGPFDRLPHYQRDWWYRNLFKEGLPGAYERIGLSFFIGLIPIIGTVVCLFMSYVYVARPLSLARLRPEQLRKFNMAMWKLLAIDFFIGLIFPIGPFFRAWFHCNMRIIHFAFDVKNEHESYIDNLYYQSNVRIRVADLNKACAVDALKMYQQYHQECIHTLYGADLMNAADRAFLHEDLARLQRDLSQAHTCQIRMENERIKSCNATQPLIKRTKSNPETFRCYHAIPPATAWSNQGAGVGPSRVPAARNQSFVPQQEPLTVPLAAVSQEQIPVTFQPLPASELPVAFQPIPALPLPVSSQSIPAPQQPVVPTSSLLQPITSQHATVSQQAVVPRQATVPPPQTPLPQTAILRTLVPQQSTAPRSAVPRSQRVHIYQPMPPRRQALVLYDNASQPGVLQTWQQMYAPPQLSFRSAFGPRQGGLIPRSAVAPPPTTPTIETLTIYQQAMAAQRALSSLRERSQEVATAHQPLVPEQGAVSEQPLVLGQAVVPVQTIVLQQASVPDLTAVREQVAAPEQVVSTFSSTASAIVAPISISPIDCRVATPALLDSSVLEAASVSPNTIQAFMALMQQRMAQVDHLNLSSVTLTPRCRKSSTPSMLRNFYTDPLRVPPFVNESNPNLSGETALEAESSSFRPLVAADQFSVPEQRQNVEYSPQALDTHNLSAIVTCTSGLHHLASDGLRDTQNVLPENHGRPLDGAGLSEHPVIDLAVRQMSSSIESDVTATEPEQQAIWEVQSDDEVESVSSDDNDSDSEDEGCEGRDSKGDKMNADDESGDNFGDQDEGDDGFEEDDDEDEDEDEDDESTDGHSTEELDYSESDKEEHYQTLVRNFNIATSLNKANNRPMSKLSTLLALESSEFSESSLVSRRYNGYHHRYAPGHGPFVTTLSSSGVRSSSEGCMPVLGVSAMRSPKHSINTSPGMSYPQVSRSDSETSSLEDAIEKVLSRRWKFETRNKQPQPLVSGPRFDIE